MKVFHSPGPMLGPQKSHLIRPSELQPRHLGNTLLGNNGFEKVNTHKAVDLKNEYNTKKLSIYLLVFDVTAVKDLARYIS